MQLRFDDPPSKPPAPAARPFTVSQIVHQVSRTLEARFAEVWVEGEVSNLKQPSSGHLYFTLKDSRAQLAVVMFRSSASRLRFRIEDGFKLRCRGKLSIYDAQGRFQLNAESAEPQGAGALQVAFEQLKRRLEAEGLFDPARKQPLPLWPTRIAVVTSPSGAALQDILRVLADRCPVQVVVCPTAVQGEEAAVEIAEAIRRADRLGVELIIVGRGGGSLEDLWAFNTEPVARAIHHARTPIISAVGHEVDITIADLVADRRAPTPTAAAELAVPRLAELQQRLQEQRDRLQRAGRRQLAERALLLERLAGRLGSPRGLLDRSRLRLDDAVARLTTETRGGLRRRRDTLASWRERLARQEPRLRLSADRALLMALSSRLQAALRRSLERGRGRLAGAAGALQALSPLAVLARGYSIVLDGAGRAVREAGRLQVGEPFLVRLHRGRLLGRVEAVAETEAELDPVGPRKYVREPEGGGTSAE